MLEKFLFKTPDHIRTAYPNKYYWEILHLTNDELKTKLKRVFLQSIANNLFCVNFPRLKNIYTDEQ